jgi:4'-phosphopantetheinyl transferase
MLRDILLRYPVVVKGPPTIVAGPKGQPLLSQAPDCPKVRLSLSHSRSFALFAIALDQCVGVDVEHLSGIADWEAIAKRYFSTHECQMLFALSEQKRSREFLSLWTLKEAYVKALGEGFSKPFDSFTILPSPNGVLRVDDQADATAASTWSFLELATDEQYLGALAIEEDNPSVLFWNWNAMKETKLKLALGSKFASSTPCNPILTQNSLRR